MNLKKLSDPALLHETKELVLKERQTTALILEHLREIEHRKLYADLGYPSLFEYCVRELGYPEASAQRRISSMRLLKELPEIKSKVADGKLSLSTLAKAQSFFKNEEKLKCPYSRDDKKELLFVLEGKSSREVERKLISISSDPISLIPERIREISETKSEMKLIVDHDLITQLEKLKGLLAHKHPHLTTHELIKILAQMALEKLDPLSNTSKNEEKNNAALLPTEKPTKTHGISKRLRENIWNQAQGKCSYIDPKTQRRCNSVYALQIDHIKPLGKGGTHHFENLRLLCFQHNQRAAMRTFGVEKIKQYSKHKIRDDINTSCDLTKTSL